jgi:hypothetical protein
MANKKGNVILVVYRTVRFYRISVSFIFIIEYLKTLVNCQALKCICDFFEEIHAKKLAVRINESDSYKLKRPFLAHLNILKDKLIFVFKIDAEYTVFTDSISVKKCIETNQYLENWGYVVILLETTKSSGEVDLKEIMESELTNNCLNSLTFIVFSGIAFYEYSLKRKEVCL